jgi:PKD repeat protein
VNFSATTRNTDFYTWDFSDGYSIIDTTSTSATHTYNSPGEFIPQLILKDSTGCTVTKTGTQVIKVYDLHAGFDFVSSSVCDRGTVTFSNTSYSTDIINSYTWNFDDGSPTVNTSNASHTYNNPGSYHPQLITTSIHGCIDTITNSIPVNIVSTPRAAISQTANGCVDLSVNFSGSLLNTDTSRMNWHWNFGNAPYRGCSDKVVRRRLLPHRCCHCCCRNK